MKNHSTTGKKGLASSTRGPRAAGSSGLSICLPSLTKKPAGQFTTSGLEYSPRTPGRQSSQLQTHARLARPSTGFHPMLWSPRLAQAGGGYLCPSPPLSVLSLHTPANRKQKRVPRGAQALTERQARHSATTQGRGSDRVKQKSSCGHKEPTPKAISRQPNGRAILPPAPSTHCPYPTHQPLLSRQLASPSHSHGGQEPSRKRSQLTAAGKVLGFTASTSSQIPRGGQLAPAVKIAHGSPSKRDDFTDN